MNNTNPASSASSKVAELVKLIQSRKKSAPPIFIDGKQIKDISELGSPVAAVGEDAAHALGEMLAIDPFETFEKIGLIKSIQEEGSGNKLLDSLEWIINEKDTDAGVKKKVAGVAETCLRDEIEPERSLCVLLKLLKDSDSDIVAHTAAELNSTLQSNKLPEDTLKRIAVALIEAYQEHSGELGSNMVRANVASAFGCMKRNLERTGLLDEALTFLEKAVTDQEEIVKASAANALSLIPTERSKQILSQALEKAKPGDEREYLEYMFKRVSLSLARRDED